MDIGVDNNDGNCIEREVINFALQTLIGQRVTLKILDCSFTILMDHSHVG